MAKSVSIGSASVAVDGKIPSIPLDSFTVSQSIYGHTEMQVKWGIEHDPSFNTAKELKNYIGKKIEITVRDEDNKVIKTFIGNVIGLDADINKFELQGISESYMLNVHKKNSSYLDMSIAQIVTNLLNNAGIKNSKVNVASSKIKFKYIAQYQEDDYSFLKKLANYGGNVFYHDGEKFIFTDSLKDTGEKDFELSIEDLTEIKGEISTKLKPTSISGLPYGYNPHTKPFENEVKVKGENISSSKMFGDVHSASKSILGEKFSKFNDDIIDNSSDFRDWLTKKVNMFSGDMLRVKASCKDPGISVGSKVKFKNHPFLEDKLFAVTDLHLEYDRVQYNSIFEVVPAELIGPSLLENEKLTKINSVQPAIVIDNVDPDKLGRVKIRFPWDTEGNACPWARVVSHAAGKSQGAYFIPSIEDEVLVAFEKGEPSMPVVLGCLWHSENYPKGLKEKNGTEDIVLAKTKSGQHIHFKETDGKQEIVLTTKDDKSSVRLKFDGPELIISTDGTVKVKGNDVKLTAGNEMSFQTKDLSITASEKISITAGTDFTMSAGSKGDITFGEDYTLNVGSKFSLMIGTDMSLLIGSKLTINSSVSSDFTSGGITSIKGAMVQIN